MEHTKTQHTPGAIRAAKRIILSQNSWIPDAPGTTEGIYAKIIDEETHDDETIRRRMMESRDNAIFYDRVFVTCPYCHKFGDYQEIGERETLTKRIVLLCQCNNCKETFCLQIIIKYKTKKIIVITEEEFNKKGGK